jgi:hypothetical protein
MPCVWRAGGSYMTEFGGIFDRKREDAQKIEPGDGRIGLVTASEKGVCVRVWVDGALPWTTTISTVLFCFESASHALYLN